MAHLNLNDDELAAMYPRFEQMIDFFSSARNAGKDTKAFPGGIKNDEPVLPGTRKFNSGFFRPDMPVDSKEKDSMLDNAGERDGRFLLVPNVL